MSAVGPAERTPRQDHHRLAQHAPQLRTFFFPPYAPELNPVEYLWSWSKMNPLANRAIHEVDQLAELARNSTRSLQHHENLLRSFIQHSPLSLRLK